MKGASLDRVLEHATQEDLRTLAGILGARREDLALDDPKALRAEVRELFSGRAGTALGNVARLFSGGDVGYDAVLDALAGRLDLSPAKDSSRFEREREIVRTLLVNVLNALDPGPRADLEKALLDGARRLGEAAPYEKEGVGNAARAGRLTPVGVYLAAMAVVELFTESGAELSDNPDPILWEGLLLAVGPAASAVLGLARLNEPQWRWVAPAVAFFAALRARYSLALDPESVRRRVANPFIGLLERHLATGAADPARPHRFQTLRRHPSTAFRLTTVVVIAGAVAGVLLVVLEPLGAGWANRFVLVSMVSAAVGFFTNFLAIKMLFRPRKPVFHMGGRGYVQGLLPRNKAAVADQVAQVVEARLVNAQTIREVLVEEDVAEKARRWMAEKLRDVAADETFRRDLADWLYLRVVELTPVVARHVNVVIEEYIEGRPAFSRAFMRAGKWLADLDQKAIAARLRTHLDDRENFESILAGLYKRLDQLPANMSDNQGFQEFERNMFDLLDAFLARLPIGEVVKKQVLRQDDREFEAMVDAAGGAELAWIQILGGVLGFLAGVGLYFLMG